MSDINRVRQDIAKAREAERAYQALQRLRASGDFRLIFTDGLFNKELSRCVLSRHNASEEQRKQLTAIADAISFLDQYLSQIENLGNVAHLHITEGLKLLDELEDKE